MKGEPTRRPRILFLADRNILANQAFNAFSAFPEDALVRIEPADIRKKGKVPKNGSLFFTIFQTFMSGQATDTVRAESIEALRPAQGERNLITVRGELVEPRTEKFTTSKRQGSKPNCIIVYQLYN